MKCFIPLLAIILFLFAGCSDGGNPSFSDDDADTDLYEEEVVDDGEILEQDDANDETEEDLTDEDPDIDEGIIIPDSEPFISVWQSDNAEWDESSPAGQIVLPLVENGVYRFKVGCV